MNARPGWLTAVCIIALALGGLGLLGSIFGAVSLFAGPRLQSSFQKISFGIPNGPQGKLPPNFEEMQELQEKLQGEILEIQRPWMTINLSLMIVNLVLSGCLLYGGIQGLQLAPSARTWLMGAFAAAILFELVRLVPTIGIQIATTEVTQQYMAEVLEMSMAQQPQNMPPQQREMMKGVVATGMRLGMVLGLMFAAVTLLVKLAFYIAGILYLRRPHIRALFANQQGAAQVQPL